MTNDSGQPLSPEQSIPSDTVLEWAERWLSPERLSPYLKCCNGNADLALELYEWNIRLGQVLMHDISHFEVALRNAYNHVMSEAWSGCWLLDDASPVRIPVMRKSKQGVLDANRINRTTIDAVRERLPSNASVGSIVANLTLGFWVHLSDRSREVTIWRTALYRAWPKGTDRQKLQTSLDSILHVRNRVAHSERLFNPSSHRLSPLGADAAAVELLRALCPEAADHLYGWAKATPVELFCKENSAPANVML